MNFTKYDKYQKTCNLKKYKISVFLWGRSPTLFYRIFFFPDLFFASNLNTTHCSTNTTLTKEAPNFPRSWMPH